MGNTSSAQQKEEKHIENIKTIFGDNGKDTGKDTDIETTIGYSGVMEQVKNEPIVNKKESLPKLTAVVLEANNKTGAGQTGGKLDIRNISSRQRYHKYDVFKVLNEVQNNMNGGNQETESSITTDDKAMDHIKNVILSQLTELQKHKQHGAGSCGCDKKELKKRLKGGAFDSSSTSTTSAYSSSSDSSEEGIFQNTKNYIIEESSNLLGGTSDDENNKDSSSSSSSSSSPQIKGKHSKKSDKSKHAKHEKHEKHGKHAKNAKHGKHGKHDETSNGDDEEEEVVEEEDEENEEEEGLSIFPFNSSDIKSSASVKNYKMLRRKI